MHKRKPVEKLPVPRATLRSDFAGQCWNLAQLMYGNADCGNETANSAGYLDLFPWHVLHAVRS